MADGPCAFGPWRAGSSRAVGHDFALVVDRDAAARARDPGWADVDIKHPEEVSSASKRTHRFAVSIVTIPYVPIERWLREHGFEDVVPFYDVAESFRDLHPLSNGWFSPPLPDDDRQNTATVLRRWADDTSRAHHLQFLAWRRQRAEWTFDGAAVHTDNRFFIPEVTRALRADEVFVDAGAHHGGVIDSFLRQTNGDFATIAAIEPDPANRAILDDNLATLLPRDPRVTCFDCALKQTVRHRLARVSATPHRSRRSASIR